MFVHEVNIRSFRHLRNIHLGPFPQPTNSSDSIALAGPNGGGKSSLLELIGYALSQLFGSQWGLRRSFQNPSFEIGIGLTPTEVEQIRHYLLDPPAGINVSDFKDVLKYLESSHIYYRAFSYPDGKFSTNPEVFRKLAIITTVVMRDENPRSLGFFLKPDRVYGQDRFESIRIHQQIADRRAWLMNTAFTTTDVQYTDMFDYLVQQRYHYFRHLGAYHHKLLQGVVETEIPPKDPLEPYDFLLQRLFPGYCFADAKEDIPSNLYVKLPDNSIIPFNDLSSGEKEVFFILAFFLRNDISDAVVIVDEPELHLHPELARLLVRTMHEVKPGNQIWIATHNPEIIDETGSDRTFYIARNRTESGPTVVVKGTDEPNGVQKLRELFGYSGYIGVARKMVFLEGADSSVDRKMFTRLFPQHSRILKFIPCGSFDTLHRINGAVLEILTGSFGWTEFHLIRDRDYLTPDLVEKYRSHMSGRISVLSRYHIENYLLVDEIIAKVQSELFAKTITTQEVTARLKSIAHRIAGEVLRDMVAYRVNLLYRPEDFSLGTVLQGQRLIDENGVLRDELVSFLKQRLKDKAVSVNHALEDRTSEEVLDVVFNQSCNEVRAALQESSDEWRTLMPGRRLLEQYAKDQGLGNPVVLQNAIVKELAASPSLVPSELESIVARIARG